MSEILRLDTIGIELPLPKNFIFHDEGYMDPYEFYNKCSNIAFGRDLTLREIDNICWEFEYGAFDSYLKGDVRHMHIYCKKELKDSYPVNRFVKAHEETHALEPRFLNGRSFLEARLNSLGFNTSGFRELATDEEFAHVGGLMSLHSVGIAVGDERDSNWRLFLDVNSHSEGKFKDPELNNAFKWIITNRR